MGINRNRGAHMIYGANLFGAKRFGANEDIAGAEARAFGGSVYGTQFYGYATGLAGEITGDSISIGGGITMGSVGGYSILTGQIGIGGNAVGAIVLTGSSSASIGIDGIAYAVVSQIATSSGDVGISGTAEGFIRLDGDITGSAIGISGQAFGYSGNVISYDRVSARLVTSPTHARIITDLGRGRIANTEVKGRI